MAPVDLAPDPVAAAALSKLPVKLYKLTTAWRRNPALTPAQFHEYLIKSYGPRFAALCGRYGMVRYTQFHTPPSHRTLLGPDARFAAHDVVCEIVLRDLGALDSMYRDPEYAETLREMEDEVFERGSAEAGCGFEVGFVEGGEVLGGGRLEG